MATASTSTKRNQLQNYYDKLFPYAFVLRFLSHNGTWKQDHRELSLVVSLANEQPAVLRYRSAVSEAEWRAMFAMNERFVQINVGGCSFIKPHQLAELGGQIPLSEAMHRRELTFDIDLTEYNDIRYCCGTEKKCCNKCWPLAVCAAQFLEHILRNVYGCRQLVWFYSGRRGVHCWVYDEKFSTLQQDFREAVLRYINSQRERIRAGEEVPLHMKQAILHCETEFSKFIVEQRLFSDRERFKKFVDDLDLPADAIAEWLNHKEDTFDSFIGVLGLKSKARNSSRVEIILKCMYPRLDEAVTVDPSHLIKMPFSIHPGTGLVCMPMTVDELKRFRPESAAERLHISVCTEETIRMGMQSVETMLQHQ